MVGFFTHGRSIEPASVAVPRPDSADGFLIVLLPARPAATQARIAYQLPPRRPGRLLALVETRQCSAAVSTNYPAASKFPAAIQTSATASARTACRFLASSTTGGPMAPRLRGCVGYKVQRESGFYDTSFTSPSPAQRRTRSSAIRQSFGANRDSGLDILRTPGDFADTILRAAAFKAGWAPRT